jgi:hypothetical protein
MLSDENLEAILDAEFDHILSLPMRHSVEVSDLMKETEGRWDADPQGVEQFYLDEKEAPLRYAVAYDPLLAEQTRRRRQERIEKAERFIRGVLARLERAGEKVRPRGRPLTAQGAFEQIHDY